MFESVYYLFLCMYVLKMNVSKKSLHVLMVNTAFCWIKHSCGSQPILETPPLFSVSM